jgi:hypothetical protein
MSQKPKKQLILTEAVIRSIVSRPDVLREFPHFKRLNQNRNKPQRSSCCGQRSSGRGNQIKMAKLNLLGMPTDRLNRLKKILKVDELVAYMPTRNGPSRSVV